MAGNDLPPIYQSSFRTRFEFSRKANYPKCRPAGYPVPAVSLIVKGNAPETSRLSDVDPRIISLQKNIQYLQKQQTETLEKLHAEMEFLKRENKELKYRLTMDSNKAGKKGVTFNRNARSPCQGAHSAFCPEEQLEDTMFQDQPLREVSESPRAVRLNHGGELTGLRKTILAPVRFDTSPFDMPRPSTILECQTFIQQLFNANSLQTQEIARLKALLADIILSKKITREHQILSKAYLGELRKPAEQKILPRLGSLPVPPIVPSRADAVIPGLNQRLSSKTANRQKRLMSSHHFQRGFH